VAVDDARFAPLILKGVRVAGASLFVYINDLAEMQARAASVIRGIEEGWLRMRKTTDFALDDAVSAHRAKMVRSIVGKLPL
jgi:NADPH:quinone reductase